MSESRQTPPEAVLIRRAREALDLSPERAAARAMEKSGFKISGRRWRQIEAGEEGPGGKLAVAGDGQLAHMANTVGVAAEELRAADRSEAAEILKRIQANAPAPVGALIERTRSNLDIPVADVIAKVRIDRAEWDRLLRLVEFEGADVRIVGQLAHAVRLEADDVEPLDLKVAREMRRVEVNRMRRELDDGATEQSALLREAEGRLRLLDPTMLRGFNELLKTLVDDDDNGGAQGAGSG